MRIEAVSALRDNYIWTIRPNKQAVDQATACIVVDPGDAEPVLAWLKQNQCQLTAILITHHHWDHTNGIDELVARYACPVYGPVSDKIPAITHPVKGGDELTLLDGTLQLAVIECPGHTLDHIAYINAQYMFVGDTLFAAGCGRMFEGEAGQFHQSLEKLTQQPADCLVYCAHEYTAANLAFAAAVEPDNLAIQERQEQVSALRQQGLPTVPSELAVEFATNPFLRCHLPSVKQAAEKHAGQDLDSGAEVFAVIRAWKDNF